MAGKYTKLFSLPENLYSEGAPVIIATGALSKNNENGSVVAQLKLQNITPKRIKAVKAELCLFDSAGRALDKKAVCQYLDLNVVRNENFASKTPIHISDPTARSFEVKITEVVFEDGSIWQGDGAWEVLPKQEHLSTVLPHELCDQYKREHSNNSYIYAPMSCSDLWFCACGAVNKKGEVCHECGAGIKTLAYTMEELEKNYSDWKKDLAYKKATVYMSMNTSHDVKEALKLFQTIPDWQDSSEKSEECKRKIAELEVAEKSRRKKTKMIAIITTPIVCVVIAFIIVLNAVIIPNNKYNDAVALMNAGKYDEAIAAFEVMNGYKDSVAHIESCKAAIKDKKFNDALALMNAGKYEEAIAVFQAITGYRDSVVQIENCEKAIKDGKYSNAVALINAGKYDEAYSLFRSIKNYRDSKEYLSRFKVLFSKQIHTFSNGDVETYEYTYDSAGNMTKKVETNWYGRVTTYEYTYDSAGNMTKKTEKSGNASGTTYEYTYDSAGNMTKEIEKAWHGVVETREYTYDSTGNMTKEIRKTSGGRVETREYKYDSAGNMTKKVFPDSDGDVVTCEYKYDSAGNMIKEIWKTSDGDVKTYEYEYTYDSAGNVTKKVETNWDGSVTTYEYTYDSTGNMTKKIETDWYGVKTYEYTYDSAGNMTKEIWTYPDGDVKTYEYEYVGVRVIYKG